MLENLVEEIENFLGKKVEVKLTENTTSLLSIAKKIDKIILRMNKHFLYADEDVFNDILSFFKTGTRKTPYLKKYIKKNILHFKRKKTISYGTPKGQFFDLKEIFDFLNEKYFENSIKSTIFWGKSKKGYVKKRILGNYDPLNDIIRINPELDKESVPLYYLQYVIYHEMLHALLKNVCKKWHGKEFKEREKRFEHYEEAIKWEKRRR
ncbi:MAG: SprT-like domain-containing protein [Proteobacteria bacterium]|nr:SprT-like domain-containing protein [Pseudomonadota bacterium]